MSVVEFSMWIVDVLSKQLRLGEDCFDSEGGVTRVYINPYLLPLPSSMWTQPLCLITTSEHTCNPARLDRRRRRRFSQIDSDYVKILPLDQGVKDWVVD